MSRPATIEERAAKIAGRPPAERDKWVREVAQTLNAVAEHDVPEAYHLRLAARTLGGATVAIERAAHCCAKRASGRECMCVQGLP